MELHGGEDNWSKDIRGYYSSKIKIERGVEFNTYTIPSADPIAIFIRRFQSRWHSAECWP